MTSSLITVPAQPGDVAFDTFQPVTAAAITAIKGMNIRRGIRYVDNLTTGEVQLLIANAITLACVGAARVSNWSAATGHDDGVRLATGMLALGLPNTTSLFCDLEGGCPNAATAVAYGNGFWTGATSLGVKAPGIYIGSGSGFTDADAYALYNDLAFTLYWRSMSEVPNVAVRGYALWQGFPPNIEIAPGFKVDLDVCWKDYLGGLVQFAAAA